MGALAFVLGKRVGFRDSPDLFTAAHEVAHVVQQRAGLLSGSAAYEEYKLPQIGWPRVSSVVNRPLTCCYRPPARRAVTAGSLRTSTPQARRADCGAAVAPALPAL